jgi:small conductance mechanosensitive channel
VLAVRPFCHTDHYWQVYFDTNRAIREAFGAARLPVPEQRVVRRNGVALAAEPAQQMRLHI